MTELLIGVVIGSLFSWAMCTIGLRKLTKELLSLRDDLTKMLYPKKPRYEVGDSVISKNGIVYILSSVVLVNDEFAYNGMTISGREEILYESEIKDTFGFKKLTD